MQTHFVCMVLTWNLKAPAIHIFAGVESVHPAGVTTVLWCAPSAADAVHDQPGCLFSLNQLFVLLAMLIGGPGAVQRLDWKNFNQAKPVKKALKRVKSEEGCPGCKHLGRSNAP